MPCWRTGRDADRQMAFEAGFDDYFVKPVDIDALSSALSRLGARTGA